MPAKPVPIAEPRTVEKVKGARAVGVREELEELEQIGPLGLWLRGLIDNTPSWLVSMIFHLAVLLVLALLSLPQGSVADAVALLTSPPEEPGEIDELPPPAELPPLPISFGDPDVLSAVPPAEKQQLAAFEPSDVTPTYKLALGDGPITCGVPFGDPLARTGPPGGGGPGKYGPFPPREKNMENRAVAAALKWLAEHQLPDGSWSFDHTLAAACRGKCRNPGNLPDARLGATGLALLPFLGAGQTHKQGIYKLTVRRGLYFLISRMKVSPKGGSLFEPGGRMYSHGIASITLCEAYALTHDKGLYRPAQQAINFICYAQDPVGGGWRYEPRQRGDTSVVGWQLMALKSAHLAYIRVPPIVVQKASNYLDGVQSESGAKYGYTDPGHGSSATTAIGLLCRMYLGWKKDTPALERGVQWLSEQGPAAADMYYNYYATQVMRHWGGPTWKKWSSAIMPQLEASQAAAGHEKGSWYFKHSHAQRGGRLYCTAMAAMVLEVPYRHLPIYGRHSVEEDFPL